MPRRMFVGDAEAGSTLAVRQQAVDLIHQARNPRTVHIAGGFMQVDKETANREAQLALAAAVVYLADIIAAHGDDDA